LDGQVSIDIQVTGKLPIPDIHLYISIPEITTAGMLVTNTQLHAVYQSDSLVLKNFHADLNDGTVTAEAIVINDSLWHHSASLNIMNLDLHGIWALIYQQPLLSNGRLNGSFKTEGALQNITSLSSAGSFRLSDLLIDQKPVPDIATSFELNSGRFAFQFENGLTRGDVAATIAKDKITGTFSLDIAEFEPLAQLANISDLQGMASVNGNIGGSLDNPNFAVNLTLTNLYYQNFPVNELIANFRYFDKNFTIGSAKFRGELAVINPEAAPFNLDQLRGSFSYQGNLEGTLPNLSGNVNVGLLQPGFANYQFDSGQIIIELKDDTVSLKDLSLIKKSWKIQSDATFSIRDRLAQTTLRLGPLVKDETDYGFLSGTADLNDFNNLSIDLTGSMINLQQFQTMLPEFPDIDGIMSFDLSLKGNLSQPEIHFQPQISDFNYQHIEYKNINADIFLQEDQLTVKSLSLNKANEEILLTANIPLMKSEDSFFSINNNAAIQGKLIGKQIDLDQFNTLTPPEFFLQGQTNFDIGIAGTFKKPTLNGFLSMTDGNIDWSTERLPLENLSLDLLLKNQEIDIEALSGTIADLPFLITSSISTRNYKSFKAKSAIRVNDREIAQLLASIDRKTLDIDATIKNLDLAQFKSLVPSIYDVQGIGKGNISIAGTWHNPEIVARMKIDQGSFQISSSSPPVKNLLLQTSYQNATLTIKNLDGLINDLPFASSGKILFKSSDHLSSDWLMTIQDQELLNASLSLEGKQISGDLTIDRLDLALLKSFVPTLYQSEGYLSTRINFTGTKTKPHINGSINVADGFFKMTEVSPPLENLQIQTMLQDTLLAFRQFSGSVKNAPFNISGQLQRYGWQRFSLASTLQISGQKIVDINGLLGKKTMDIHLTADSLDLSLANIFTQSLKDISGQIVLNLDITGTPKVPHVSGRFNILNAGVEIDTLFPKIEAINLASTFQDSLLTLQYLNAQIQGLPLQAQGTVTTQKFRNFQTSLNLAIAGTDFLSSSITLTPNAISSTTEITDLNLSNFQTFSNKIEHLNGLLNASLKIEGLLSSPDIMATAHISNGKIQIRGVPQTVDSLETSLSATDTSLYIQSFTASVGGFPVRITGNVSIPDRHYYNLNVQMQSNGEQVLFANGQLEPKYNDLNIEISNFNLLTLKPFLAVNRLEGHLSSSLQIAGTRVNPHVNGDIRLSDGLFQSDFRHPLIEKIEFDSRIENNYIQLSSLNGQFQTIRFNLSGDLNLENRQNIASRLSLLFNDTEIGSIAGHVSRDQIEANLAVKGLDISTFKAFFPEIYAVAGLVNLSLKVSGSYQQPTFNGVIDFQNGQFQLSPETHAVSAVAFRTVIRDTTATIDYLDGTINNANIHFSGRFATRDWNTYSTLFNMQVNHVPVISAAGQFNSENIQFDLQIQNFDIGYIQPFITSIDQITGTIVSDIEISGSPKKPNLFGNAQISDIGFHPIAINETFSDGLMNFHFQQTRFILDTLIIHLNKGTIQSSGYFAYREKDISDIDITTALDNIKIQRKKEYQVAIKNSKIHLSRLADFYELDGDIVFGDTRILHTVQPKTLITRITSSQRPSEEPSPILKKIRMNIRIRDSKDIWIDNNLARVRLRPDIAIIGTAAQTNISGRLMVEEGYILYLDRKFKVTQGVADFVDPNAINPIIDFIAVADIKSYQTLSKKPYTVTLQISGPADEAVFTLSSEPSLDKSDIIALLTLGATREELVGRGIDSKSSGIGSAIQDRLTEYSSQRISSFTSQKIGTLLGLEEMSIDGNLFSFGKSWGPQLVASKKLSDRMSVTYSTTIGHMNEQNVRLDYKLNENFSLEGQTDQRGQSGLDLKYKLKFK